MKYTYIIIGFLFDLFDWIGIGMIPILGDIVDLFTAIFWYTKLKTIGLISLIEIIPVMDILPTNIALGYLTDTKGVKAT